MKTGIELISEERSEQLLKHGRSVEDDIKYNKRGSLAKGAVACIKHDYYLYPDGWSEEFIIKTQRKSELERLIIAGALIAAEIDRIQNDNI